jgi:hypothetical protein
LGDGMGLIDRSDRVSDRAELTVEEERSEAERELLKALQAAR